MMNLFIMGGSLFMGILTLLFLSILVLAVLNAMLLLNKKRLSESQLSMLKSIGIFTMVTGILGQLIGIFSAFDAIEQVGEVSQAMLVGGLKVSSITTIYGIIIYLFSYLIWFGETAWNNNLKVK